VEIIGRARWRARHRNGFEPAPVPWRETWAHHSVTLAPDLEWIDADGDGVEDDEAAAMRQLEQIGQDRFGGGISYTAAIPPSGRIYEGHGVDRQGAHTAGRNNISRAIVFIGNYEVHRLTRAQIRSAARLLAHWHQQGWCPRPAFDGGHQQAPNQIATSCPGRYVLEAIPEINRLALAHVRGEINLSEEDDLTPDEHSMLVDITATPGGLRRIEWLQEVDARLRRVEDHVAWMAQTLGNTPDQGLLPLSGHRQKVEDLLEQLVGEVAELKKTRPVPTGTAADGTPEVQAR